MKGIETEEAEEGPIGLRIRRNKGRWGESTRGKKEIPTRNQLLPAVRCRAGKDRDVNE